MLKIILIMSLFLVVGCDRLRDSVDEAEEYTNIDLPVTIHFAIEDSLDAGEWQDFITITINSENIVTDVELNSVSPMANNLRRDIAQLEGFEEAFGYNFYDQATTLEHSLIGSSTEELITGLQNADTDELIFFDTTTFANLADIALRSAPVERGPYIDGAYHSIKTTDENEVEGVNELQYFVNLFIINGDIVAVHFNALNHEGLLKYDQHIGAAPDFYTTEWRYQAQLLEQALIDSQDPEDFTFDEDGFTTDIPGVYIEIEPFISLVVKALTDGPVIEMEE